VVALRLIDEHEAVDGYACEVCVVPALATLLYVRTVLLLGT